MDAKTFEALKGSIEKWEKVASGEGEDQGPANCPLCIAFPASNCAGCPVAEKACTEGCGGTPYMMWLLHADLDHSQEDVRRVEAGCLVCVHLAQAELDFLKSLLPVQ